MPPSMGTERSFASGSHVEIRRVFNIFQARFLGKASPVHLSGARLTLPWPGSPVGRRPRIRAECRTSVPM